LCMNVANIHVTHSDRKTLMNGSKLVHKLFVWNSKPRVQG